MATDPCCRTAQCDMYRCGKPLQESRWRLDANDLKWDPQAFSETNTLVLGSCSPIAKDDASPSRTRDHQDAARG